MMLCYGIIFFKIKAQIIHYAAASLSAKGDFEIHNPINISCKNKPRTLSLPSAQP